MSTLILAFFGMRATEGSLFRHVLQLRFLCTLAVAAIMAIFAVVVRHDHPIFYGELILTFGLLFQHAFFDWYFICGKFWKKLFLSKLLHSISYMAVMGFALLYLKVDKIEHIASHLHKSLKSLVVNLERSIGRVAGFNVVTV